MCGNDPSSGGGLNRPQREGRPPGSMTGAGQAQWRAAAEGWSEVSAAYEDKVVQFTSLWAPELCSACRLDLADTCLDVAAGTGALSLLAAGQCAHVDCNDFSEGMLSLLRAKAAQGGLTNVATVLSDGAALPVEASRYDVAFSNFGVIFFPDCAAGLAEMHRVLKAGGRLGMTAWCPAPRVPAFAVLPSVMAECWPGRQAATKGRPDFTEETLAALLTAAGFEGVEVRGAAHELVMPSAEAYWQRMVTSSPGTRRMLEGLSEDQQETLHAAVLAHLAHRFPHGEVRLNAEAFVATATKPLS